MATAKILVVEDEIVVARDMQQSLESLGYEVVGVASSAQEAIDEAEKHRPDIVLMDIVLKGETDGIQAANEIGSRFGAPIVYVTAYGSNSLVERAKITEPDGYIVKPFTITELRVVVEIALHKAKITSRLKESEQRFRSLFNTMNDGVVMIASTGRIVQANPAAERILGLDRSEIEGRDYNDPMWRLVDSEGRPIRAEDIPPLHTITKDRAVKNAVVGVERSDAVIAWVNASAVPLVDKAGRFDGVVVTFTDVTELRKFTGELEKRVAERTTETSEAVAHLRREAAERRQAEQEQTRLRQRLEALWEVARLVDADYQVLCDHVLEEITRLTESPYGFFGFLNEDESVVSMFSWSKEAMKHCEVHDKPLQFSVIKGGLWADAVRERKTLIINDYMGEHPAKKGLPDGHVSLTRTLVVPVFSQSRIVSLVAVANKGAYYTEDDAHQLEAFMTNVWIILNHRWSEYARKAAERELAEQRALSIRSDRLRSLGEMAAGIAHELNQPLVGVRGIAQHIQIALDRGWSLADEDLRERIGKIIEQADRMTRIIQHVRMFTREAGKLDQSDVNLNQVVKSSVEMLGTQFRSRGIELRCELADDLPTVLANPFSLEEVVLNLLLNARDAVEDEARSQSQEKRRIVLRTQVDEAGPQPRAMIQVIDNGCGIQAPLLENIFDPFFTTKGPDKGTGLGLSISKSIVETFDGTMAIESTPGQGTTATVSLPTKGGTAE